jgi:TRAP-type C4-dicarboxylate transport system substrate-binding protein
MPNSKISLSLAALLLTATGARADVKIKLGTLAPVGSTWHELLKEMGEKWSAASGGQVKLKIYAGGVFGNEGDMVRKMNVNQLQAGSLTTIGLHEITPEPQAVDVPLMVDSVEEYEYIQSRLQPELEAALAAKNYIVLQWGEVGFARFFSTKPYASPKEMAKGKIFAWEGDPAAEQAWRTMGLHPVVISSTDIVPALQTGMINIVTDPPLYVFSTTLYEKTKYMLDLNWGYLTGATVVRKDAWEKIPEETRTKLLAIAAEYGAKTSEAVRRMNDDALKQMKDKGLQVIQPSSVSDWEAAGKLAYQVIRGKVVPAEIFDKVQKLHDEFRAQKK